MTRRKTQEVSPTAAAAGQKVSGSGAARAVGNLFAQRRGCAPALATRLRRGGRRHGGRRAGDLRAGIPGGSPRPAASGLQREAGAVPASLSAKGPEAAGPKELVARGPAGKRGSPPPPSVVPALAPPHGTPRPRALARDLFLRRPGSGGRELQLLQSFSSGSPVPETRTTPGVDVLRDPARRSGAAERGDRPGAEHRLLGGRLRPRGRPVLFHPVSPPKGSHLPVSPPPKRSHRPVFPPQRVPIVLCSPGPW